MQNVSVQIKIKYNCVSKDDKSRINYIYVKTKLIL